MKNCVLSARPMVIVALLFLVLGAGSAIGAGPVSAPARGLAVIPMTSEQKASAGFMNRESFGLFVGVSRFRGSDKSTSEGIADIPFAVDDAVDLAHLFSLELQLLPASNVTLALAGEPVSAKSNQNLARLIEAGATRTDANLTSLLRQIRTVCRGAGRNGLLVLSFATHGFSAEGDDRLLAADSLMDALKLTALPVHELLDQASAASAPRRLVLIDACRERLRAARGAADPTAAMSPAFQDAVRKARGIAVLTGATAGGFSYDDEERQNGVCTSRLIEGLRGDAPSDERGFITTNTLAGYVNESVKEWVRHHRPEAASEAGISFTLDNMAAAAIPLAVNKDRQVENKRLIGRRGELVKVLQKHIDFRIITSQTAADMTALLEEADEASAVPLVHRLDILERIGPAYAPDLALWWKSEGLKLYLHLRQPPNELRAATGWYSGTAGHVDQERARELFEMAFATGHPLALMWKARLLNRGRCGYREDRKEANRIAREVMGTVEDLAREGDSEACFLLGSALDEGIARESDALAASRWYEKAAEMGYSRAMLLIGEKFFWGKGVVKDSVKARQWWLKAADLGDGRAMDELGRWYFGGHGGRIDFDKALEWWMKSAERGDVEGMNSLGYVYSGESNELMKSLGFSFEFGVTKNYQTAREWYEKAAQQGSASAMNSLGNMYKNGKGVDQDYNKAREWYEKAADLGNGSAMCSLGLMYERGEGVSQDDNISLEWFRKAAERGDVPGQIIYNKRLRRIRLNADPH